MRIEASILAEELGKLGGKGARWASRFLPMSEVKENIIVQMNLDELVDKVTTCLDKLGSISSELSNADRVSAIMGSGALGLNPAILHIYIKHSESTIALEVHALAKEGLIKQGTAITYTCTIRIRITYNLYYV